MEKAETPRYFTIEKANAIIRAIRPLVAEILEIREDILDRRPQFWPVLAKAAGDGGGKAASEVAQQFHKLDMLVREIRATGAILKDINTGMVDFLALREGREVYLCWKYGEDQITYWHELDAGYAGRRLIT